ncbi:hypothetical protein [Candidatus Enterococcus ferrettii]|uniref:Fimbrial assembly protein (PilN) n=1 Tax=Candidatus Enterococcus ferrettii TaxID=2815324 RepID=A0ABV0EM03_9ENTE|nr:hypothetical protein [Enterococcus sp. 665A]MBO1343120.1 hypothetical protein [Enterococcus sp. 665A]
MFIINILSVGLVIVAFIIVLYRFVMTSRLKKIEKQKGQPPSFYRKLAYVKYLEQEKHVSYLLFLCFLLAMGVLLSTYNLFELENQLYTINQKNAQTKDELYKMREEQRRFINDLPIQAYPENGLGLGTYDWPALFEHENRKQQYEIENELSAKAEPYFGLSSTLIVLDIPSKTLSIALMGHSVTQNQQETLESNQLAFVKEAEAVPHLTQITFQMHLTGADQKGQTHHRTFTRTGDDQEFVQVPED